jgi:hypothetical protein
LNTYSVIVIGKNEEAHLATCLRSVQAAAEEVGNTEIVYVDSASTDRSVEIAQALGVRVLSLRPEWKHTPAAGRYIGFHHTTGELLMFVDGDCVIERQWLARALAFFTEPDVAGVAGYLRDFDEAGHEAPFVGEHGAEIKALPTLRGIAAYRRAALEQVGPFNPHLRSEEEAELALRLRKAHWRLLHLPFQMGSHRRALPRVQAMWRAWRLGRVTGVGQTWRYACQSGTGWQFCFQHLRTTMMFAGACLALSLGVVLWELGDTRDATYFLYVLLAGLLAVALKKRDLLGPVSYTVTHLTIFAGLLSGLFITRLAAPESYPRAAIEVGEALSQALPERHPTPALLGEQLPTTTA